MNQGRVIIRWTDWIETDSEYLDYSGAIYAYGDNGCVYYLGKADRQTVGQRLTAHRSDGVGGWIRKNGLSATKVKVGELTFESGQNFSAAKLDDIESLLIRTERKRGFCGANVCKAKSYNKFWPGLLVQNQGSFEPLLSSYREDRV